MTLCRTCLSDNGLQPIFTDTSLASTRCKQLYSVTGVKIEPNDGFPQVICTSCASLIQSAIKLRLQCSKSEELLKKTYTIIMKIENNEDLADNGVKDEQMTEYCMNETAGQLKDEFNSNDQTLIQIQNTLESSNSNLVHELKKNNCNSKLEHKTNNIKKLNSNSEYKKRDLRHRRKSKRVENVRKRQNYPMKKLDDMSLDYKYTVLIEDFESSNDELMEDICIEDLESPDEGKPSRIVRIEDFESSDGLDLDDFNCDSTDLDKVKEVDNQMKKEISPFEREKKRLSLKAQDRKLMSLAVRPYNNSGPIKCRLCDSIVSCVRNFKCHAKTHFELQNACEECGKKFVNRNHMMYHQQRVHGRIKRLSCTHCTFRAVDPQTLRNHERAEHTGERPFVCNECGVSFRMRANIVQHMRKHFGVRDWQCDRCPSMFRSRSELWGHQNKVHFMVYTYLCYLCPETYKKPLPVRRHLANIHGVPIDQQLQIKCVKTRRRITSC